MLKWPPNGEPPVRLLLIPAIVVVLLLFAASSNAFEYGQSAGGTTDASAEDIHSASVDTLSALGDIVAGLEIRENTNGTENGHEKFYAAMESLSLVASRLESLQWSKDRAIDFTQLDEPDYGHIKYLYSEVMGEHDSSSPMMSSLFVMLGKIVSRLHDTLMHKVISEQEMEAITPILPAIRNSVINLVFVGDVITQVSKTTYSDE